jgi:hypothetical protein
VHKIGVHDKQMEQGRLFEHYYAHYLFYHSNYFESLIRIQMDTKGNRAGAAESTNIPYVTHNKGSNRKAVIEVWIPLSVKFQHYYLHYSTIIPIILAIIHIISKDENAIWAGFIAETSPFGSGNSISSLVVRHDQCALSYRGSGGGRRSSSIGGLDVFQPTSTHGWTNHIAQGFDRLGDISALVLPQVICNTEI